MPTALVILAPGFEEIEAATPIDVLRRAGVEVTVVGLDVLQVTGSRGLTFVADCVLADAPREPAPGRNARGRQPRGQRRPPD